MSYSKDEKDWLGRERTGHYDDNGKKTGFSKEEKDIFGRERAEHFDTSGNKTGSSKVEKDLFGNERVVHYDKSGNEDGYSRVEKKLGGQKFIQHYDRHGNKTGESKYEQDFMGRKILRHSGNSGDNKAIGFLIVLVLIVIVILGTFSFPYKIVEPQFAPFSFDWLSNKTVWIFCGLFWIFIVTGINLIRKLTSDKQGVIVSEYIVTNALLSNILFWGTLSAILSFVIKSRLPEDFILFGSIAAGLVLIMTGLIFWKTSKALQTIIPVVVAAAAAVFFVNQADVTRSFSANTEEIEITETNTQPVSSEQENTGSVTTTDESIAKEHFDAFNNVAFSNDFDAMGNLLSDQVKEYMKLKNVNKSVVVDDKRAYFRRWKMNEITTLSFDRMNPNKFSYTIGIKLQKAEEPGFKRDYLLAGQIGFDKNNKINVLKDVETVGLFSSKVIPTASLGDIAGTAWFTLPNETTEYGYYVFNKNGSFTYNLSKADNYTWKVENDQLIIDVAGYTTITCTLDNNALNCHSVNSQGKEWDMTAVRKK